MLGGIAEESSDSLVNQCFQSMEEITEDAVEITEGEEEDDVVEDDAGKIEAVKEGRDDGVADNDDASERELRLKARLRVLLYK